MAECPVPYFNPHLRYFPVHGIRDDGSCTCGNPECKAVGKHPYFKGWQLKATNDTDKLALWAATFTNCNWGIATGAASGISVVDIDNKNRGLENWDALLREVGEQCTTYTIRTGGGGIHMYFQYDGRVPNDSSVFLDGVDSRNDGGLVVAPGSLHESGSRYEIIDASPIAKMPEWLLERFQKSNSKKSASVTLTEGVREGGRNNALASITGKILNMTDDDSVAWALVRGWNQAYCEPPLEESEVEQVFESILSKDLTRRAGEKAVRAVREAEAILHASTGRAISLAPLDAYAELEKGLEAAKMALSGFEQEYTAQVPTTEDLLKKTVSMWADGNEEDVAFRTGFPRMDRILHGMRRGGIYVIQAETGVGKSALCGNLALNMALQGHKVYVVSFEMPGTDYMRRILSGYTGIPYSEKPSQLERERLENAMRTMASTSLVIEGCELGFGADVEGVVRRMERAQADVYIIDYIQQLEGPKGEIREQEVSYCVNRVWHMAQRMNAVLIAPAQENKEGQVRESSAIKHIASAVLQIKRKKDESSHEAVVKFLKNRHGPTDQRIDMLFEGSTYTFREV